MWYSHEVLYNPALGNSSLVLFTAGSLTGITDTGISVQVEPENKQTSVSMNIPIISIIQASLIQAYLYTWVEQ